MMAIHCIAYSAVEFLIIYLNILKQLTPIFRNQIFCYEDGSGKQGLIN